MELFLSDLHINQILVDNSVCAVNLGGIVEQGRKKRSYYPVLCVLYFHTRFPCAPFLLSCLSSALKSKMQNGLAWLFGKNRNCLSSFMMCSA